MMNLLDRRLIKDLSYGTLIGSFVAVVVLVALQIVRLSELIVRYELGIVATGRMLSGLALSFTPLVVPIAFLFSLLGTFGQMATDRELVALQSMGFSSRRICRPVFLVAVVVVLVSLWLSFSVGPGGNRVFESSVDQAVRKRVTSALRSGTFSESFLDMVLFVDRVDPGTQELQRVFVFDEKNFDEQVAISAKTGRWIQNTTDGDAILSLKNGVLVAEDEDGQVVRRMDFDEYRIRANFVTPLGSGRASPASLNGTQLLERRAAQWQRKQSGKRTEQRPVWVELARRFGVSFACLLFVPLAWILSLDNRRTARSRAVFLGLVILFSYWTLYFSLVTWVLKTKIPWIRHSEPMVWAVVWLPNVILAVVALALWALKNRQRWRLQR